MAAVRRFIQKLEVEHPPGLTHTELFLSVRLISPSIIAIYRLLLHRQPSLFITFHTNLRTE